jgi:predicted Fe-Mo cluster-binding NifX family protein
MKICIPVMGQNAKLVYFLANDFYKANYYCLYDLERSEPEYFSKSELMTRFGLDLRKGGGDDVIGAIISPNVRPMAYKILHDNKIDVYRPASNLVEENIALLKKGDLPLYDPAIIENSSCGSSCSSCSSTSCSTNSCAV